MQRISPFRTLDAFRGFAALWVVMDHSCDRFVAGNDPRFAHVPLYAFSLQGQLGVFLFFVISGYCIVAAAHGALYSGKTVGRYAFERCRRIFPPYWCVLILGTLATLLLLVAESHHWIPKINHPQAFETSPIYWLANLTLTQSEFNTKFENIVFWSLCYEVCFYAIVGVWLFVAKRIAKARDLAAGQLALILGLALTTFSTLIILTLGYAIFPFDMWHEFAFGGLLFYLIESKPGTVTGYSAKLRRTINVLTGGIAVLAVVFVVLSGFGMVKGIDPAHGLRTAFALGFCLLLALIRPYDEKIAASRWLHPLIWIGAFSYSLYLIHGVVLPFIDVACRKVGLDHDRYWIAFWIQVVVAVLCGKLFYMVVERHFVSTRQIKRLEEEHVA